MSLEVNNIPSTQRSKIKPRLRNYTHDLDVSRHSLVKFSQNADRDALFGPRAQSGSGDAVVDQRQQLLSGTDRLERSSQRLRDSQRIANETEEIGASILGDLGRQREQIVNSHNTLNDSERYLDRSIKTLRGMARRYGPYRSFVPLRLWDTNRCTIIVGWLPTA